MRGGFPSWRVRSMRLPALAGSALRFFLDNHGHAGSHRAFLFLGLAGTALSCVCTALVLWSGMGRGPAKGNELLRRSAVFSSCLLVVEVVAPSQDWSGRGNSEAAGLWSGLWRFSLRFTSGLLSVCLRTTAHGLALWRADG